MFQSEQHRTSLLLCLLELVIGILLLINPIGITSWALKIIGIVLLVRGISVLLNYFRTPVEEAAQSMGLASGLLFILFGLFLIFKWELIVVAFPVLTLLYGLTHLVSAIFKLQWAVDMFRMKKPYWYLPLIFAILGIIFFAVIAASPFASTVALWNFVAITLIVEAVFDGLSLFFHKKV